MGTMYNALFGTNPISSVLLTMLGLTKADCGRFRDCFIDGDGERIAVYTRNGGGNREHWDYTDNEEEEIPEDCRCTGCIITHVLPKHPLYIRDEDDDFDCTYATIYFRVPDEFKDVVKKLATGEKFDPDQRWMGMLDRIRNRA